MATQAIKFTTPPGLSGTITINVVNISDDTLEQTAIACTESTNAKGVYTSANFTDTLAGRFLIVVLLDGDAIGNDLVDLVNANGIYDSHGLNRRRETRQTVSDSENELVEDVS